MPLPACKRESACFAAGAAFPALLLIGAGVLLAPTGAAHAAESEAAPRTRPVRRPERLPAPGVLLTFDDHTVASWIKAIPIFAEYGAHVTFFVDHWDKLTPEQIEGLRRLHDAGHAVACHGLRHRRAVDYCRRFSVEKYLEDEILPAVAAMRRDGFNPSAFAYPCSQHDAATDTALLKIFRHLRSGCGRPAGTTLAELDPIFTPVNQVAKRGCLIGTCVQPHSPETPLLKEVRDAFRRAAKRREIVVFYAHDIRPKDEPGPRNFITPDALAEILAAARDAGLRFYTFDDLP